MGLDRGWEPTHTGAMTQSDAYVGGGWFLCCIERTLRQSTEKLYSDKKSLCMLLSRASSSTSCLRPELWFSTSGSQRSLTKSSLRPFWIFLTSSMRSYHPTTIPRQWKRKTKEGAVQCKETQGAREFKTPGTWGWEEGGLWSLGTGYLEGEFAG